MSKFIRRDENSIDKLFRQKLHDAEETAPLHLWEGVRQRTAPRRKFIWWWFAGAIVALGLITWAVAGQYGTSNEITAANQSVISDNTNENNNASDLSTEKNSTEEPDAITSNPNISNSHTANSTESTILAKDKPTRTGNKNTGNKKIVSPEPKALSTFSDNTYKAIGEPLANAPVKESLKENIGAPAEPEVTIAPTQNSDADTNSKDAAFEESPENNPVAEVEIPAEPAQHIHPEYRDEVPPVSSFVFSIGAYGLAGIPQGVKYNDPQYSVLSSNRTSYNNDPKNSSQGLGVFGKIESKKHFTLQLGFDTQKVISKVNLTVVTQLVTSGTIPDTTSIEGFVPVYIYNTSEYQAYYNLYNTYLLVGKDFYWRKIYFGIQTGPVLRFNTVKQALPETYNDSTYVIYPAGKRMDLQASAQFGVLLNDQLSLFVQFQQRWMLPFWKTSDSRMVHPAIGLGMSYKFN